MISLPQFYKCAASDRVYFDIPQGHKVALTDFNQDEAIVRYGEVIGYAIRPIQQGSWIDESLVKLPTPPKLDELPIANKVPETLPSLEGYTFEGYRNEDGSVGTKNILGITTSVQCVRGVLEYAVKRIKEEFFTTGRGTPYGLAMAPVIKVSTRNSLTEQWQDLIDVNAGRIATGEATIEEVGWEIFHFILDTASGRKQTWAEHWGLHNDLCLFNPAPIT